jgi:hypothetical protein
MAKTHWIVGLAVMATLGGNPLQAEDREVAAPLVRGGGAVLTRAVRVARTIALERIAEVGECRELFTERGADGGRILLDADYRVAQPGEAGGLCEKGASAFTGMTTRRTALCRDSFLKLPAHVRAVVLLHEALHVAGMGQYPLHPGEMTARQIDGMVSRSCDL